MAPLFLIGAFAFFFIGLRKEFKTIQFGSSLLHWLLVSLLFHWATKTVHNHSIWFFSSPLVTRSLFSLVSQNTLYYHLWNDSFLIGCFTLPFFYK